MSSLNNLSVAMDAPDYYSNGFARTIENHLDYLRGLDSTKVITVEPHLAYTYEHDFYGLLHEYSIESKYHWTILRINNMHNPHEYLRTYNVLYIPSDVSIDGLMKRYITNRKKEGS
jgi:hypothetical protein